MASNAHPSTDDIKALKALHKEFAVTLDIDLRNRLMIKMVGWYTGVIPFIRSKFSKDQEKAFTMSEKIRQRALDPRTPSQEQDTALRMMLRYMENAVNMQVTETNTKGLPVLAETIAAFEAAAPALQAAADKKVAKYQPLLASLSGLFGDFGLEFLIDDRAKTMAAAPGAKVLINPDTAAELAQLEDKKLFFQVSPIALKACSVQIGTQGNVVQDFSKYTESVKRLLNVIERTMDPNVIPMEPAVRPGVRRPRTSPAPGAAPSGATRTSRKQSAQGSDNPYNGSKATVWERLRAAGPNGITLQLLYAGLPVAQTTWSTMLWHLSSDGKKNGRWAINVDRKTGIASYTGV